MECFDILIIGDNFIETDEVFRVTISTFFPDFVGDPRSATINITRDGDGKTNKDYRDFSLLMAETLL